MGKNRKYIKKIANWGGKSRDLESVIRTTRRFTTDQNAVELITNFYILISATEYLKPIAYEFLFLGKSVKRISQETGKTENSIYKILDKQHRKIENVFVDDLIELIKDSETNREQIIYYRNVSQQLLTDYRPLEYQQLGKLFTFNIVERMQLDHGYNANVNPEEFEAAIELLQMTVTPFMDMMLEQIDIRMYGYIMGLLKGDKYNLTERDLARKEHLETSWLLNI